MSEQQDQAEPGKDGHCGAYVFSISPGFWLARRPPNYSAIMARISSKLSPGDGTCNWGPPYV